VVPKGGDGAVVGLELRLRTFTGRAVAERHDEMKSIKQFRRAQLGYVHALLTRALVASDEGFDTPDLEEARQVLAELA
jgi:hypothetical protein